MIQKFCPHGNLFLLVKDKLRSESAPSTDKTQHYVCRWQRKMVPAQVYSSIYLACNQYCCPAIVRTVYETVQFTQNSLIFICSGRRNLNYKVVTHLHFAVHHVNEEQIQQTPTFSSQQLNQEHLKFSIEVHKSPYQAPKLPQVTNF